MKILALSDLHINSFSDIRKMKKIVRDIMSDDIELVIITGDILESGFRFDSYSALNKIFNNVKVVCVLGNHEFFDRTVSETLDYYSNNYNPEKYNVHYLDIIGHYDIGKYRFFGNVLWYDGSMSTVENQNLNTFANGTWADILIHDFDWKKANNDCVKQIIENRGHDGMINVLCTHCCPNYELNLHMGDTMSQYNAFSGMNDFLIDVKPNFCFCGHTHWRTIGKVIHDCVCVNVGNGMYDFKYLVIDI